MGYLYKNEDINKDHFEMAVTVFGVGQGNCNAHYTVIRNHFKFKADHSGADSNPVAVVTDGYTK